VADYFVLVTGQNRSHVRALYNEVHVRLKAAGELHQPVEGAELAWWIVADFGSVVLHVMQREAREYYDIERLYSECERLDWAAAATPALPATSSASA
jgi:ribosome-associated protein